MMNRLSKLTRGNQYGDRLILSSSVTVLGDTLKIPAFRVGSSNNQTVAADVAIDLDGGPALEVRLWPDPLQPAVVPLRVTPTSVFLASLTIGTWRLTASGSELLFQQQTGGDGGEYTTQVTLTQLMENSGGGGGGGDGSVVILDPWRIRPTATTLVFEEKNGDGEYETKMLIES
jgi:hypothetical protein